MDELELSDDDSSSFTQEENNNTLVKIKIESLDIKIIFKD